MNVDLVARQQGWINRLPVKPPSVPWNKGAFVLLWEAQSQVASIAYVALVAFFNVWAALPVMLLWSLLATIFYFGARERGYPNLLNCQMPQRERGPVHLVGFAARSFVKAWLSGFNAWLFARCSSFVVANQTDACRLRRGLRLAVIAFGLTIFGVSSAEHTLRSAGYKGTTLTRLGLLAPFLNVPYRVLLSAMFVALVRDWMMFL
jgi:hypothetical protein